MQKLPWKFRFGLPGRPWGPQKIILGASWRRPCVQEAPEPPPDLKKHPPGSHFASFLMFFLLFVRVARGFVFAVFSGRFFVCFLFRLYCSLAVRENGGHANNAHPSTRNAVFPRCVFAPATPQQSKKYLSNCSKILRHAQRKTLNFVVLWSPTPRHRRNIEKWSPAPLPGASGELPGT